MLDKKRKRNAFEISSYEGKDVILKGTVDIEDLMKRFNKRMREGGSPDEGEGTHETMEGVPNEIAMAMMSFMSFRELRSLGETSRTNRSLVVSLMGRSTERPYNMRLMKRRSRETEFLLDRDCFISIDPREKEMLINDVLVEDNPISDIGLAVSIPRIVFSGKQYYEIEKDNRTVTPIEMTLSADDFARDIILSGIAPRIEGPVYHSPYGTIALTLPTTKRSLMNMTQRIGEGHDNHMRRAQESMDRMGFSTFTLVNYLRNGRSVWLTRTCKIEYASFLDENTILFSESWGEGKENTISVMDPSNGSLLWRMGIEDMSIESSCVSINRMILFSVSHPRNMKRTVFLLERGPKVERAYHLHSINKGRIIKRIAYERGTIVMLIGKYESMSTEYEEIISLDVLYGRIKRWKVNADGSPFYVTQARGLQFQINKSYFRVLME